MYEIRPESIKTFIEDTSIELPRFQRRQSWDAKKNFELCISIFKEFPMGVCILNLETDGRKISKWLLDGRQRRNALKKLWEDPENIYQWAKKWAGFKGNAQPDDVANIFWEKIDNYLEAEEEEEEDAQKLVDETSAEVFDDEALINEEDFEYKTESLDLTKRGLHLLLEIILLVHNKTSRSSNFTRPFDFSKVIKNLPYDDTEDGKSILSSKKLKSFIAQYMSFCTDENLEYEMVNSFKIFITDRFALNSEDQKKANRIIDLNWTKIIERIEVLEKIRNILIQSKIGLIEIKNIPLSDAQKIFNIINSKGTKLNAVEILSAKPSWNLPVKNPSQAQIDVTDSLYKQIGVNNDKVVKWDLPATLLRRLENFRPFFNISNDSSARLDKQLTLGFKLISGIFEKGVKKDDIDKLSKNPSINWNLQFESLIAELNLLSKLILSTEYFKYFNSWNASVMGIMSEATALNFILVLFEDWKRKGKPIGSDKKAKQFQKNSFILIDQLIFEYVNRQWRGSSDSKIASNLSEIPTQPDVLKPIDKTRWANLLDEIFATNTIDNFKINQKLVEPILYHFYSIKKLQGPSTQYEIEVDHIIPQSIFASSALPEKEYVQHNLFNLGLLPKDENISKGNKKLGQIQNKWLKDQIEKYEFIKERDFQKFSDVNNFMALKKQRVPIFKDTFDSLRDHILNN
ncbi:MAG TPA: DUF262 domain-containing protein [Pyrinomonadaceae bacterium]|jgi:hypothetical protein